MSLEPISPGPAGRVILTYGRSLMALVIARSLAQRGVEVIGCDDVDLTVCAFSRHVRETFTVAPWRSQPERFLDDLEAAVRRYAPRDGRPYVLMPVFAEIELIARRRNRFEPTITVAAPLWESISLVTPKDHFAQLVEREELPAPRTWIIPNRAALEELAPQMSYPLIVKPSDGAGGRGVSLAQSQEEAMATVEALGFSPMSLFQVPVPGQDYCVAVLANEGRLEAIMAYRNLTTFPRKAGAGAVRETVDAEPFRVAAEKVVAATAWTGLAEIDFRWSGDLADEPKVIEVNARFWAGIFHSIQTAVDFPWLLYRQTIGEPLDHASEPHIGARTKTPGIWLLAAIEEVTASEPHVSAVEEAWHDLKRRLSARELSQLHRDLHGIAVHAIGEIAGRIHLALEQARGAPGELSGAEDPLVGLGTLFVLSSLVRHGRLPDELTFAGSYAAADLACPVRRTGRPAIGVTMPEEGDHLAWAAISNAVWLAGGRAVKLTARAPQDPMTIDALIFAGGTDVYPGRFDGTPKPGYDYDIARGDMEVSWGLAARRHDLPVLGVCRGAQMLNVIAGGTLHMDLSGFKGANLSPSWWDNLTVRKTVSVQRGSRLAAILGQEEVEVNVIHQQAIDRLGVGLSICAREDNGVVQAIEDRTRRFWIGVQYHPEFLIHHAVHRRLFRALVEAAKVRREERCQAVEA